MIQLSDDIIVWIRWGCVQLHIKCITRLTGIEIIVIAVMMAWYVTICTESGALLCTMINKNDNDDVGIVCITNVDYIVEMLATMNGMYIVFGQASWAAATTTWSTETNMWCDASKVAAISICKYSLLINNKLLANIGL